MTITNKVLTILKSDTELRDKIMEKMNMREPALLNWIYRESHRLLGQYAVIKIIKEHTGLEDHEIFEEEDTNISKDPKVET